jgi:amino acid transporter
LTNRSRDGQRLKPGGSDTAGKLGTFAGVFTPSILTILGLILFLRLGYVVGNSGLARALAIMLLANAISVLTSLSVAAVATNLKVKGGGVYYLISRTLGVGFGGAIGLVLFLAQAISIGFYCIGFAEATAALFSWQGAAAIPSIAAVAILLLFVLAWLGADWATRFQYVVMAAVAAALISFAIGAMARWDDSVFAANWVAPKEALPFWVGFAIFFPAVTGFTQGINMSGDLRDPGKNIPLGTFLAVGLSAAIYIGCGVLFAAALPNRVLAHDLGAMKSMAVFAPLIDVGVIAATLSSALASFLGAPRILQSLARDRIFPLLQPFAHGTGEANNPRRAVALSAAIALAVLALGELNLVASVVSMFFLTSYGLLNYATYYEARAASPSFRPSFRLVHHHLSLLGGLGCLGAMLAIDLEAGIVAVAVVFAVFQYLRYKAVPARWADSRRSYHLQQVREHLLAASAETEHARDWRPQLLVFSDDPRRRQRLLRFASWIEGASGFTTVVRIIEGQGPEVLEHRAQALAELEEELKQHGSLAFPLVVSGPDLSATIATVLQSAGTGPLRANTVVVNWVRGSLGLAAELGVVRYGQNLRTAFRLGCNLLVLDADDAEWAALEKVASTERTIDVWWSPGHTGELMLILAHLMKRSEEWEHAAIRLLSFAAEGEDKETAGDKLSAMLEEVRIDAQPVIVENHNVSVIAEHSKDASIVFLPFSIHGGRLFHPFGGEVADLLSALPIACLTLAAQDVDLDADPDEGKASLVAAALDRLQEATKKLAKLEEESQRATAAAEKTSDTLLELVRNGADPETLAKKRAEAAQAQAAARTAAAKAAHALALKEAAERQAQQVGAVIEREHDDDNASGKKQ